MIYAAGRSRCGMLRSRQCWRRLAPASGSVSISTSMTVLPSSSMRAGWASEGVVSKRKDSLYRSGRSPDWLKMKNPACEAVKREAEEDWGKERRR
jgi:hypothetical protein